MKLLIVDDEKLTREGLLGAIDWPAIGIHEVETAEDGINGIEVAKDFNPDIVLSDVRMPRMNGIDMCEKLQEINEDLRIVFMSGYSDKEYLKAAIKLKAVSYVEKPIDEAEISDAVKEACELSMRARHEKESAIKSKKLDSFDLAMKLCFPNNVTKRTENLLNIAPNKTGAFTFIVKLYHYNLASTEMFNNINSLAGNVIDKHYLRYIGCQRQGGVFVFHVFDFASYNDAQKMTLGEELVKELSSADMHFHVVIGKSVEGLKNVYESYNSAVIELQNCFFIKDKQFLVYKHYDGQNTFQDVEDENKFKTLRTLLIGGRFDDTYSFLETELMRILSFNCVLPNQVKDLYYKYFNVVDEVGKLHGMSGQVTNITEGRWGMISACESVFELNDKLTECIDNYFAAAKDRSDTSLTVAMIKEYIDSHFTDDELSIKDISEHIFLSASYACTLFKNETGKTLNQYITEYRIDRAKELLLDPRNRIGDISRNVGYSDSNYFGKTFKKQVGMTPSEYRDSNTK